MNLFTNTSCAFLYVSNNCKHQARISPFPYVWLLGNLKKIRERFSYYYVYVHFIIWKMERESKRKHKLNLTKKLFWFKLAFEWITKEKFLRFWIQILISVLGFSLFIWTLKPDGALNCFLAFLLFFRSCKVALKFCYVPAKMLILLSHLIK